MRLEQLQRGSERMRNDSQGSAMSSERSDSDRGGSRRHEKGLNSCPVTVTYYVLIQAHSSHLNSCLDGRFSKEYVIIETLS